MKDRYVCGNCGKVLITRPEVTERYEDYFVVGCDLECECGYKYHVSGIVYLSTVRQISHWCDSPELIEVDENLKEIEED